MLPSSQSFHSPHKPESKCLYYQIVLLSMQSNIHWPKQNFNVSTIYSCEVSYPFLPKSMFKASKPLAFILNVCDFDWDDACACCPICQFPARVCLLCELLLKRLLFSSHLSLSCKTRFLSDNPKLLSDFTEDIASSLQIFKMARDICHLTSHSGIEIHKLILSLQ